MSARRAQLGIGMSGILIVVALLAFFGTLLAKLGPAYASFWTVTSIMQDVASDPGLADGGRNAIFTRLRNLLDVNDVRSVDPAAFTVEKVGSREFALKVDYEERQHLFFNVDTVLSFQHEVTVGGQ